MHTAPPDLVLTNARVHTVDPALPAAEAVAITGGRISAVGTADEVGALAGTATEIRDLGTRMLLPGFVDAHNHVRLGSDSDSVQLAGADTLEKVHARIRTWIDANPEADWIEGEAFDYGAIPGGRMPTAADLDVVTGDRPALVFTYDVHSVWLNTAALCRLGITRDTGRLPWGVVEKDPATGEPTGFLTGFAVLGLARDGQRELAKFLPWAGEERRYKRLCASLDMAATNGLTTVVEPQNSLDDLGLFERARREGRLRSRLIAALFHPRGTTAADLDDFAAAAKRFDDDRFRVGPLKLYIDDVVEPHTAALLDPYVGDPGNRGRTFYEPAEFARVLTELDRRGFQTFTHATGDRGIRTALDAHRAARTANGPRDVRHQLVHVECLHREDVHRFAELDLVACMQPRHCAPDVAGPGKDWAEGVGEGRWPHAWAFRSLREAGARLAFSSDWNVAEMDPLAHLYTAVTRRAPGGGEAWVPGQTIDLATAIEAYTLGSAYANFAEHDRGSVTVGKYADLVVVSEDLFAVPDEAIKDATIDATVVEGEFVFER